MAIPFDRAASRYIEAWVPRFVPYHLELVRELALSEGQRVMVARSGPGAEVLAVARAVGERGHVRATDPQEELIENCRARANEAGFATTVTCECAAVSDTRGGPWNAIVCAFGLWTLSDRPRVLRAWSGALTPSGKIGVLAFGPPDESDPFEVFVRALKELEPDAPRPPRIDPTRETFTATFEEGGLALVRHTTIRHNVSFPTAEAFVDTLREGRSWRSVFETLGPERSARVTARFYDEVGGPTKPLVFQPTATLAIAALPGAEVELASRPSVIAPRLSKAPLAHK